MIPPAFLLLNNVTWKSLKFIFWVVDVRYQRNAIILLHKLLISEKNFLWWTAEKVRNYKCVFRN